MGLMEDEELAARGATHPRVSVESMEARIAAKSFTTLEMTFGEEIPDAFADRLRVVTLCTVVVDNGFVLVGKSAPASIENFDKEKGETFAYQSCIQQMWQLEGYLLCEKIAKENA